MLFDLQFFILFTNTKQSEKQAYSMFNLIRHSTETSNNSVVLDEYFKNTKSEFMNYIVYKTDAKTTKTHVLSLLQWWQYCCP